MKLMYYNPFEDNPFMAKKEETQNQQSGQQISPDQMMQGLQMAKQFGAFGGAAESAGAAGSAGSAGAAGAAGSAGSAGAAGSAGSAGAAGSAGGFGGAMAAAGPWAALAAVIYANESYAMDHGYRSENKGEYTKDLFSGEVFNQDMEQRWLPKIGLKEGSKENKIASFLANPLTADPGDSWERIKDIF